MGYCYYCKEEWTGRATAHCTGCHRTFKSVNGFDRHRRDFKCLDPADCGMEMKEGIWSKPMPEKYKKQLQDMSQE